ncbi:MAG: SpoIIE family protein phosphatase, partial [Gemmatimonadetes bacterium]|nr:SpoIIE family protein phosphatase [Gemmatimonadota bacterium]
MDDLRATRFKRDYLRELSDLYYFYLDDERRAKLASMGRLQRAFLLLGWILKSLYLKLSPPRRILLLIAAVLGILGPTSVGFPMLGRQVSADLRPWGFFILLIVLMLELKDKLLARDEIEIARQVQLDLLPRKHPPLPGWSVWSFSRPANDVGGDLVDYIELDGFRHGVVLGDVAGKGLGAALLSAKLQATIRALVPDAVSLEDLGTRVNTIFYRDGLDNRYATLFYAELEYHSDPMRYLNAGHNPAFVIRTDGVNELRASSFPVGMMEEVSYEEGSVELETGDMLLAYSDGLTEATNLQGEEYGVERVRELLPQLRAL